MAMPLRQPALQTDRLTPAREAALILETDGNHFLRLCRTKYAPLGLAQKRCGVWFVSTLIDPRLSGRDLPVDADRQALAKLAQDGTLERHLGVARKRWKFLIEYQRAKLIARTEHGRMEEFLRRKSAESKRGPESSRVGAGIDSVRTLRRLIGAYRKHGIAALVPQYCKRGRGQCAFGAAAKEALRNILLGGNDIRVTMAYRMVIGMASEHPGDPDWQIPKEGTVRRWIKAEIPKIQRVMANRGERAARAMCVPHGHRERSDLHSNDEWEGDERKFDIMCRVLTDRGWVITREIILTAWKDRGSGMITGYVVAPYANNEVIKEALKIGIAKHGKPLALVTDNGKDYRKAMGHPSKHRGCAGRAMPDVLEMLGIKAKHVLPYRPESKSIESTFRTLSFFDKLEEQYIGSSPAKRHEDRMREARRNMEHLPTMEDMSQGIAAAIDAYHHTPSTAPDMFGKTPLQAMEAFRDRPARMETPAVLNHVFASYSEPRLVRRDGVRLAGRWFYSPRLTALQGQRVILAVQPDDASRAWVCENDADRKPLFEVECAPLRGYTSQGAKELAKLQREILRPAERQTRAARALFVATPAKVHHAHYAAGIRTLYGDGEPTEAAIPAITVVRPELQAAIEKAEKTAIKPASIAVRTGTDDADEIAIADILEPVCRDSGEDENGDDDDLPMSVLLGEGHGE